MAEPRLLQAALEWISICNGACSLHSAAVVIDGQAVAFTGHSGTGKSTRAQQWIKAFGAELLSGDRPQITIEQDGGWLHGVPWDGKEQCFCNRSVPLKAIQDVRRSDSVRIRRMTIKQKIGLLMQQCFIPMWDTDTASKQMCQLMLMARKLPIYRVFCGPDENAAREVYRILYEHPEEIMEAKQDMKAAKNFTLRNVVGEHLIMPTGDNIGKYNGTVILNEVSAFVWEKLQNPVCREDLLAAILDEFEVDAETAGKDLDALLEKLESYELLEKE